MLAFFSNPYRLLALIFFWTAIPALIALVRVVQIPTGTLTDDLRYIDVPVSHWLHALAGITFDVLGPVQFIRVLKRRYGRLHRIAGRVFVVAGVALSLSGISLLFQIESIATQLLDTTRGIAGVCLIITLGLGLRAALARNMMAHRAWMIRSYGIGIGSGTVSLVMFPIYLATGEVPPGIWSDLIVVGTWIATILVFEWIVQRGQSTRETPIRQRPLSTNF